MPHTLLIVDDSMVLRSMIADLATEAGWQVAGQASNGQEAIERYQDLRPDLVTLDLIMPEFDGMYALRGIRQVDPAAKVIVVSALEQKGVLREAFSCGATDFVLKPIDKPGLLNALMSVTSPALLESAP
jgi:two-component system chemotaxis response regulator CheY